MGYETFWIKEKMLESSILFPQFVHEASLSASSKHRNVLLKDLNIELIEWCFTPLLTIFQSYHGDSSHYSCFPGFHQY